MLTPRMINLRAQLEHADRLYSDEKAVLDLLKQLDTRLQVPETPFGTRETTITTQPCPSCGQARES